MADTKATASAEELAKEHGIDLESLTGTGTDGKVVKADVEAAIASLSAKEAAKQTEAPPAPEEPTAEEVTGELEALRGTFVIVGTINDGSVSYRKGKEDAFLDHLKVKLEKGQIKPKTLVNSLRAHKQGGTIKLLKS